MGEADMSKNIGRMLLSQELLLSWLKFEGGAIRAVPIDPYSLSMELTIEHPYMAKKLIHNVIKLEEKLKEKIKHIKQEITLEEEKEKEREEEEERGKEKKGI